MSTPLRGPDDRFATAPRSEAGFHPYKRHGGTLPNTASGAVQEFKMWNSACLAGEVHPTEFQVPVPSQQQIKDMEQQFMCFMHQVKSTSCGLLKKEHLWRSASVMLQFIWCALRVNYDTDCFGWIGQTFDYSREPVVRSDRSGGLFYFDQQGNCVTIPRRGEQWYTDVCFPHLAHSPHFQTAIPNPNSSGVFRAAGSPPPGQPNSASDNQSMLGSPIHPIDQLNGSGGGVGGTAAGEKKAYSEEELNDDGDPIVPPPSNPHGAGASVQQPFAHGSGTLFGFGGSTSSSSASAVMA
eukprot:g19980.t1